MSTGCQKTTVSKAIPTRRVTINDAAHMPHDYSTTPGGTLFSTTPGGVTSPPFKHINNAHTGEPLNNNTAPAEKSTGDDAQFEMDI
ncbi:eukaryotic translation initiation factor 4E-binding protein 1 isoform X1 [Esox lucius]|uniref:eukaryotic translation initiation factor 4E-binding protein 1 isoform X1 n=1 Tax=Esox lucius TaxID=8010 RepID=UPI0005779679|nr:eukaryotic translation initiation factor 4E-binding protein 1 isoform X1 [Esox lucius]